ncbi:pyridoxal phosphate-dependent aminotransferase [Proteiniclasticum sp. QWL-01]|uniref:pyridoxal phosphate-dependent aminotransferase n=1 Tax=Proteiniclasticum sp. QWL-01 TaxID=3036945 RepID=UPI00240EF1FF|nr:pyridoxal phosphate-dependent aminotransferase [Proteiniclasticum sp. QWL-01]WFF71511.1 pyridoxal phosphate-dependent aminotransferase [Proteiniclasticum sp. QWL-01]
MKYAERVSQITPSVTLQITAKAGQLKQEGKDVIGFGAGEPDFNTPDHIIQAAIKAMYEGKTKYTPTPGINELKQAIVKKFRDDNGLVYEPAQILVSTGAKQSLANAMLALVDDGDEVLMAVPYWVSYPELVKLAGGVPVYLNGSPDNQYKMTPELIEQHITPRSKILIINSPNNPSGTIYSREELSAIADVCKAHDLIIISDEIYEKLIYGGIKHESIAAVSQDAFDRTIVVNGVSKAYAMTGWRIGYLAGPTGLVKQMSSIQSHMTSNPCSIAQYASLEAIAGDQSFVAEMKDEFEARRDLLVSLIEEIPEVTCIKPEGAFYVMMDVHQLFGRTYKGTLISNAMDFSDQLLSDQLVAVVPGEGFGIEGFIRLSYATSKENIRKGMTRVRDFIAALHKE